MSGLEVVAAVAAVISAFHGGSELLKVVKEKRRFRKARDLAQQHWEEEQLQTSLIAGKQQIELRYNQDQRELGDYVRIGDGMSQEFGPRVRIVTLTHVDIARDRLCHVALMLQAEIIKSLRLAATNDFCVPLNLRLLYDASITNRKETIVTLDELKQRIYVTRPMTRHLKDTFQDPKAQQLNAPLQAMQTNNYNPISPMRTDHYPRNDNISSQHPSRDSRHALTEYCGADVSRTMSTALPPSHAATQIAEPNIDAALESLRPDHRAEMMNHIQQMIETYQKLSVDHKPDDPIDQRQHSNGYPSRLDPPAMLHGDDPYDHDSSVHRDPQRMFRQLPPASEEHGVASHSHPATSQHAFDTQREQHPYNQRYATTNTYPQMQMRTTQPRWSAASESSLVDSTAASLNRNSSSSSQGSIPQVSPLASHRPPRPDHARFPLPPNVLYHQNDEDRRTSSSAPALYAAQEEGGYTPSPVAPVAPIRTRTQPNAPSKTPPRIETNTDAPPATQSNASSPLHTPWTGGHQRTDSPPITQYTSPQRYSVEEAVHARQPMQPQYWAPPPAAHGATSMYSAVPRQHPSIAPVIASPSSSSPVPIGILPGHHRMRNTIRSDTIQSGPAGGERMMHGRPDKQNDYWGFCKGAWAVRESPQKGLSLRTQPSGYYSTRQLWGCKSCTFTGAVFKAPTDPTKKGNKSIEILDPRVRVSGSGIRYRWLFLAKSHVRKKAGDPGANDDCFGCVLCSAEGSVTGVYGGVETLMNHIRLTHVGKNMSEATRNKVNCVVGRVAGNDEDFDVNMPMFARVEEEEEEEVGG